MLNVIPPAAKAKANTDASRSDRSTRTVAGPAMRATPAARHTRPGRMKLTRQPKAAASSAVVPEAEAAPRLPYTPLRPSSRPSRRVWVTSIAEPTRW